MPQRLSPEVLIVGGGIAGLWLHRSLAARGYQVLTLERQALGAGQTLAAQGIIHGGLKYGLGDTLEHTAGALSAAPARWAQALAGRDPVDLRGVAHSTHAQWLWPLDAPGRATVNRLAETAQLTPVTAAEAKQVGLRDDNGLGYRLNELVVDVSSVVRRLADLDHADQRTLDPVAAHWRFRGDRVVEIEWSRPALCIAPQALALCAGAGNEALLARWSRPAPPMQRRALHMVMLRHPRLPALNVHMIDGGTRPRLTLTTHWVRESDAAPEPVWYLGGALAEEGVARAPSEQYAAARSLLKRCLPGLAPMLSQSSPPAWRTLRIDRAEPRQADGSRPGDVYCEPIGNALILWPTKLALAPRLADIAEQALRRLGVMPSSAQPAPEATPTLSEITPDDRLPPIASPPWRTGTWRIGAWSDWT